MINRLYTLYDSIREVYEPPIVAENSGTAMRYANERLKNMHADLHKDFELYEIGSFNHTTGEIKNSENKHIERAPSLTELKVTETKDGNNNSVSTRRST